MEAIGSMSIEILVGNGVVNLIFDAFGDDEQCFTIDSAAFSQLCERMTKLATQENGHDLMSFDKYPNVLPIEDEPSCDDTN